MRNFYCFDKGVRYNSGNIIFFRSGYDKADRSFLPHILPIPYS